MLWNFIGTIMLRYLEEMPILCKFGHEVQMLVIKALVIYDAKRYLSRFLWGKAQ